MKAALLAAGEGKRLRPATYARPKPLLPIAGSTLFEFNLSMVSSLDVYAVVSYRKELFLELSRRLNFKIVDQGNPLGTGHAVMKLGEVVKEDLLLLYSDIYLPPDAVERILSQSERYDHVVAVALVDKPWEFGVVDIKSGLLRRIVEKPRRGEEPSDLVVAGAFFLSQSILDHLADVGPSSEGEIGLTDALTLAASRGENIGIVTISPWVDAGRPSDFLQAQRYLLDDVTSGKRPLPEGYSLEKDILISKTAGIEESDIEGPAAIGGSLRKSRVGPYTYIEHDSEIRSSETYSSVIMRGSMLLRAEVSDSLLSDGCQITDSKLIDSVTAPKCQIVGCRIEGERIWESKYCPT